MAKTQFSARDIPAKVPLRGYHYKNTLVEAIKKGFAGSCDFVTALALFGVAERTGIIEVNPRDKDEYRILSPKQSTEHATDNV